MCSGEQLALSCHTNGLSLSWNVYVPGVTGWTRTFFFATNPENLTKVVDIEGVTFQFSKISASLNSLLISKAVVNGDNVTSVLNGTEVNCTQGTEGLMTTTIFVVGEGICTVIMVSKIHVQFMCQS